MLEATIYRKETVVGIVAAGTIVDERSSVSGKFIGTHELVVEV